MTEENYLKLSFFRDYSNDITETSHVDYYVRELLWLLPSESQVFTTKEPVISDVEIPTDSPIYGTGGGGGDIEFVQLLITFLKDNAVVVALISAIALIASKFIDREKDSEITIEIGDRKFTIKGPIKPNQDEIIEKLFPELSGQVIMPAPSKLTKLEPRAKINIKTEIDIIPSEFEPPEGWIPLGK